ncbi:MAG: hypothetical protein DWQ36_11000 [Acidobacteria bacterium]|nr:MAG: hypothetical protein DWQ30_12400 [Acidobacteriota bacterium]REK07738.1 MAG: hypothetical protein DWQ36_11000 [Acidobacteriota bacterium]
MDLKNSILAAFSSPHGALRSAGRRCSLRLAVALAAVLPGVGAEGSALDARTAQVWWEGTQGIPGVAQEGDVLGVAMAACDFDGDGYEDLAIGIPGDRHEGGKTADAGAVLVVYGSPRGLVADDSQTLRDSAPAMGDMFGYTLAAGFFDTDAYCDLAVGIPWQDLLALDNVGAFAIHAGGPGGLQTEAEYFFQEAIANGTSPESGDMFGSSLAAGDFNDDTYTDLAVGAALEDWDVNADAGHVFVYHGGVGGLTLHSGWTQARSDLQDDDEAGDRFGDALSAGDFDGDGYDDLAIGVPGEEVNGVEQVGAVQVIPGGSSGLDPDPDLLFSQETPGISAAPEHGDRWGTALAAGDFDGDGSDDLAVGTPHESVDGDLDAGAVGVLYGSILGPDPLSYQSWTEDVIVVLGGAEPGDQWGFALATGDIDGDGFDDLIVGAPYEDVVEVDAGAFTAMYGSDAGIVAFGARRWSQDLIGLSDSEEEDWFGYALTLGDFDGNGHDEAAVGAPREDSDCMGPLPCIGGTDTGMVTAIGDGSIFVDGFESGDTTAWSDTVPSA